MKREDIVALGAGLLFGVGLAVSGMTLPSKVVGFFDFFGNWDPSLAFVMLGAIAFYMPAYRFVVRRASPLYAKGFFLPGKGKIDGRLLFGSALFGVGWGMGGFCPGPAMVSAGSFGTNALVFGAGLLGGMVLFHHGDNALAAWKKRREAARVTARPAASEAEPQHVCAG